MDLINECTQKLGRTKMNVRKMAFLKTHPIGENRKPKRSLNRALFSTFMHLKTTYPQLAPTR